MHSKVLFWQFYFKGEVIIQGDRNVAFSEYIGKYYSRKSLAIFVSIESD